MKTTATKAIMAKTRDALNSTQQWGNTSKRRQTKQQHYVLKETSTGATIRAMKYASPKKAIESALALLKLAKQWGRAPQHATLYVINNGDITDLTKIQGFVNKN